MRHYRFYRRSRIRPTARNEDTFAYNERSEVVFSRRGAEGADTYAYAYDGIGNLQTATFNAATNTYTHNALNQIETATIPSLYTLNFQFPTYKVDEVVSLTASKQT